MTVNKKDAILENYIIMYYLFKGKSSINKEKKCENKSFNIQLEKIFVVIIVFFTLNVITDCFMIL